MAIVITNGNQFIYFNENGMYRKTYDFSQAVRFKNANEAIFYMKKAPAKTKNYYVFDTDTNKIVWRWLSEKDRMNACVVKAEVTTDKKSKKIKRKHYSASTKRLMYEKYNGKCQLCGKKLTLEDMTLDHIIPLAAGGIDDVENLWIACKQCNWIKADTLPEDFQKRIATIFMYQMEKKRKGNFMWEIASSILRKII